MHQGSEEIGQCKLLRISSSSKQNNIKNYNNFTLKILFIFLFIAVVLSSPALKLSLRYSAKCRFEARESRSDFSAIHWTNQKIKKRINIGNRHSKQLSIILYRLPLEAMRSIFGYFVCFRGLLHKTVHCAPYYKRIAC